MWTEIMAEIKATLYLKSGERKQYTYSCVDGTGNLSLTELHKSSVHLQQEINNVLTILVEEEKSQLSQTGKSSDANDDEDFDDDEDDEKEEIVPPEEKRRKT